MSVGVYGLTTLQGNWVEDRLQPEGSLSVTGGLEQRKARKYESDIAYVGERYDVLSRISRLPNRPSFALPDDGFRERDCTYRTCYAPPRSRTEYVFHPPAKPRMITSESVPEVSFENRRPLPGKTTRGFGSVLNRHDKTEGQRFFSTASGEFYGEGDHRPRQRVTIGEGMNFGGVSTEHEEHRPTGMKVGCLCGENFNESTDPSKNTRSQRSWMYQPDPALTNVAHGGSKPKKVKGADNELSIPIGDGAMAKVRKQLTERQGKLYRSASLVTKGMDKRWGVNIFMDG
eukprot:TRINITY_DN80005_c0_g1_i1.p1 TRINITY_DN80005_c0_g1~~TRINITY_DN80005_c0_g1_i1.p1  ORF type:complete len:287 (+),score=52.90 TRINITY_DN80005_c0_g1_i1:120-980(+)